MDKLTPEQRIKEAQELQRIARRGLFEFLYAMKLINEKKYFKELGYDSMADYCQNEFDMARASMYNYLQVAEKFLPAILPKDEELTVQHVRLSSLGIVKLRILAGLEAPLISELITSESVTLGKKTYTIEDFKAMEREALRKLITGAKEENKPGEQLSFEFDKIYSFTERTFNKIIIATRNCKELLEIDQQKIEMKLREIAEIMDSYKTVKKI